MYPQLFLIALFLGTTFFSVKTLIQKKELSIVRLVVAFILLGIHLNLGTSIFSKGAISTTPFPQMLLFGTILLFASIIKQMYYDFRSRPETTGAKVTLQNILSSTDNKDNFPKSSSYRHIDNLATESKDVHLMTKKEARELQEV